MKVMVGIHIFSWITQFIGHGVYESKEYIDLCDSKIERAPALTDNILLIFVAPFFFVFEILYRLGYKKDRVKELNKLIAKEIDFYRKQRKIK